MTIERTSYSIYTPQNSSYVTPKTKGLFNASLNKKNKKIMKSSSHDDDIKNVYIKVHLGFAGAV